MAPTLEELLERTQQLERALFETRGSQLTIHQHNLVARCHRQARNIESNLEKAISFEQRIKENH